MSSRELPIDTSVAELSAISCLLRVTSIVEELSIYNNNNNILCRFSDFKGCVAVCFTAALIAFPGPDDILEPLPSVKEDGKDSTNG